MIESDELIYSRYLAEHNEDDFRILLDRHNSIPYGFSAQGNICGIEGSIPKIV